MTLWTIARQAPSPWDSPGKSTGVGCHALQGIFLIQGLNPSLLHYRQILYHWATKEPLNTLTTLEIPRFFGALCQELGTKTTYILLIILQEHSNWYIGSHPDLDIQGFSTFKLRSVWVSLQKYDIHSSWQYLSTPVLCARNHVRHWVYSGDEVSLKTWKCHETCNIVVGCHQTNTPSCMYSTQMHFLDTLLLLLHRLFGWWGGGRHLWTKRQNYSKYSRKSRPNKEKRRRHR